MFSLDAVGQKTEQRIQVRSDETNDTGNHINAAESFHDVVPLFNVE